MWTEERKRVISWAFYDWANSAYFTTVIAAFFPIFFKQYWNAGVDPTVQDFRLGTANSVASLVIVVLAPILGAIADRGGIKKKLLFSFAALGVLSTGALALAANGQWLFAIVLYALGNIGVSGSNIFYDALLVAVAPREKRDSVSALGYALGYLGGGLLFGVNILMTQFPGSFGLEDSNQAFQLSFVSVAIWWAVFSIPILLFVEEPSVVKQSLGWRAIGDGFHQLRVTLLEIRKLRVVALFLLGYWFYIDGVDTIIRMAMAYGLSLGFDATELAAAVLLIQFVGFPAAILFGRLGELIGTRRAIFIGLGVYIFITIWAYFMDETAEFYGLAIAVALVQGGVQSLSRSYYSRLIPQNKAAEFFGFYNMLGKFAAVIGPSLMGIVGLWTGSTRQSILAVVVLFVVGAFFLYLVDEKAGKKAARELEVL